MSIEIKAIEPRDDKRQVAFFVIDGKEFSCGNVPTVLTKAEDIQAYLDSRADEFTLLLLKRQYPESDHKRFQKVGMTEIGAMKAWITAGHKNKVQIGLTATDKPKYGYEIVEKQALRYRHPKEVTVKPLLDAATTVDEIKAVIQEML